MKKSFKKSVNKILSDKYRTAEINNNTIRELEYLFEFASPAELKKSVLEIFLSYLCNTKSEDYSPKLPKISEDFYFLIKFLDAAEKDRKRTLERDD
jgi:hypothetical protein